VEARDDTDTIKQSNVTGDSNTMILRSFLLTKQMYNVAKIYLCRNGKDVGRGLLTHFAYQRKNQRRVGKTSFANTHDTDEEVVGP
jgi:hypothetical protein